MGSDLAEEREPVKMEGQVIKMAFSSPLDLNEYLTLVVRGQAPPQFYFYGIQL